MDSVLDPLTDRPAASAGPVSAHPVDARAHVVALLRRRWVPIVMTVAILVAGMVFEFAWIPLVYHQSRWFAQGDMWGMFRAAHYVGWGDLGGIYTTGNGVVTFPGLPVLLAPVAMLSGALNLTESYNPMLLAHPTAVFLLLPAELLMASTVVFAADALAEEFEMSKGRRAWVCVLVGLLAWPTAALWGHAEDALVMTFALLAMRAMLRAHWVRTGWLLGLAIVFQPLIALVFPLFLAASPRGQRLLFTARCAALSAFTVGVCFLGDPSGTYRSLVQQPTPPSLNHATPWVALAPTVPNPAGLQRVGSTTSPSLGHGAFGAVTTAFHPGVNVSGGPGRMLYILAAVLVAVYVWCRPQPPLRILWLAAGILAARCAFEAVMTPYYLVPPLVLLVVLAGRQSGRRFALAAVIGAAASIYSYYHLNEWVWWLPIVAAMAAVLALAYPGTGQVECHDPESGSVELGRPRSGPVDDPGGSSADVVTREESIAVG